MLRFGLRPSSHLIMYKQRFQYLWKNQNSEELWFQAFQIKDTHTEPTSLMATSKNPPISWIYFSFLDTRDQRTTICCPSGNTQGCGVTCPHTQFQKTTLKGRRKSIWKMRHSSYHRGLFLLIPNCSVSESSYFQPAASLAMYRMALPSKHKW